MQTKTVKVATLKVQDETSVMRSKKNEIYFFGVQRKPTSANDVDALNNSIYVLGSGVLLHGVQ